MHKLVALSILLWAGCNTATFGAGAPPGHPPPLAPGATVERWDHFCALVRSSSGLTHLLDEASESGWQMVGFGVDESGNLACFKRPRAGAPPAAASR